MEIVQVHSDDTRIKTKPGYTRGINRVHNRKRGNSYLQLFLICSNHDYQTDKYEPAVQKTGSVPLIETINVTCILRAVLSLN